MRRILFAAAIVAVGFTGFGSAAHADHACNSQVIDGGVGVYVVVDDVNNNHGGVWIYAESNGEAGLQRNDDSCNGEAGSDTVIF